MFYKRPLVIVFVISLGWHLFWMAAVSIVILPNHFSVNKHKAVNFLGALFKEITITSNHPTADLNLDNKIEAIAVNLHPENEENLALNLPFPSESSAEVKEEKEIPEIVSLIALPGDNLLKEKEKWQTDKGIKYALADGGRIISVNRLLTSDNPEDDILKMRAVWLSRVYSLN